MFKLHSSTNTLFYFSIFWGSMISISANNPLLMWIGLEINLMTFIPLMLTNNSSFTSASAMKYFLVQTITSFFILFSTLSFNWTILMAEYSFIISLALFIKMGLAPYHFWLPPVMQSLSWKNCLILSTWQKIAPIFITLSTPLMTAIPMYFILLSLMISGMGGMSQTNFRPLLGYSSMSHMTWCILASLFSSTLMVFYLVVYFMSTYVIMMSLDNSKIFKFSHAKSKVVNKLSIWMIFISLMSMGGVPPLLGFIPKFMTLLCIQSMSMLLIMLMIIFSTINLSYYMNMVFSIFLSQSTNKPTTKVNHLGLLPLTSSILLLSVPLIILYAMIMLNKS